MKSVRVVDGVSEFVVEEVTFPKLRDGSVRVRVEAAFLPPFFQFLPGGDWNTPPRPFTPGQCAVGVVDEVDDPKCDLVPGQRVYCDMYIEGDGPGVSEDQGFIGCFGVTPSAGHHLREWSDGTFAEYVVAPSKCFTPIPEGTGVRSEILCRTGWFGTALAGLQRGGFQPGMVVAVNGAAGLLGTSSALTALAMGAAEVRLVGRRADILDEIAALDDRIVIEGSGDAVRLDMILDCAGGDNTSSTTRLIERLRRFGSAVFVGALTAPLNIDSSLLMRNGNTLIGSFWFPGGTAGQVLSMIASGVLGVSCLRAETYSLDEIDVAMHRSVEASGGLCHVALKP